MYGKSGAIIAAALVASSSVLVEFSTNARGYTMIALMTLLALGMGEFVRRRENLLGWISLVIIWSLGMYTLPTMVLAIGGIWTWLALSYMADDVAARYRYKYLRYLIWSAISTVILTAVLYLPALLSWRPQSSDERPTDLAYRWSAFTNRAPGTFSNTLNTWSREISILLVVIFLIGFVTFLVFRRRIANNKVSIVLAFLIWLFLFFLVYLRAPWPTIRLFLRPRVWLFLLPLLLIWIIAGLAFAWNEGFRSRKKSPDRGIVIASIVLTLILAGGVIREGSIYTTPQGGTFRGAEDFAVFLESNLKAGDAVFAYRPMDTPLRYYFELQDMPTGLLMRPSTVDHFDRGLVIVRRFPGLTPGDILNDFGLNEVPEETEFNLLFEDESAKLYEFLLDE